MPVYLRTSFDRGPRGSRHGRTIGLPQTLTICLLRVSWLQVERPYSNLSTTEVSEAEVRQRLMLEEEAEEAQHGLRGSKHSDRFTCTKFLVFGLNLERNQYVSFAPFSPQLTFGRRSLRGLVTQEGPDKLSPSTIELRTTVRRQLTKLRQLQRVYQPELNLTPLSPDDDVLNLPLFLPSGLPRDTRSKSPKLAEMEKDLRLGQCSDALDSLRINLHSKSGLLKDKYINVRHQGPNTRSREFIGRISSRISVAADRYTVAYTALDALDPDSAAEWRTEFRPLHANDIRGMSESSLPDHPDPERASAILARTLLNGGAYPEGNHALSWIWRGAPTSDGTVSGYNEGLAYSLRLFHVWLTLLLSSISA